MNDTRLLRVWVITIITEYLDSIPINLVPIEFLWYDSLNTQIRRTKWPICFVLGTRAVLCTGKGRHWVVFGTFSSKKALVKKAIYQARINDKCSKIVMIVLRFIFSLTAYLFTINTFYKDNLFVKRFVISRKKWCNLQCNAIL